MTKAYVIYSYDTMPHSDEPDCIEAVCLDESKAVKTVMEYNRLALEDKEHDDVPPAHMYDYREVELL